MELKIVVKDYNEAYGLKMEVDRYKLRPNAGYTWKYTPVERDIYGCIVSMNNEPMVEFEFDDSKWATYFQLRWS